MEPRKVVVTGATFPEAVARELQAGGFTLDNVPGDLSETQVIERLQGAWGYVLGGSEHMSEAAWSQIPGLAAVTFLGTGYSSFMEVPAHDVGIDFSYTPHANATAVAEFAVAQMLDVVRGVTRRIDGVRVGQWNEDATRSLVGARLGIAGLGHIGREVARMSHSAFNMDVYYWNRTRRPEYDAYGYTVVPNLLTLCEAVDVLVICFAHVPGENDNLIGEQELAALGVDGYLINATRADLVDPQALRLALTEEWIAGASFDGYYQEPTPHPENDPYGLLELIPEKLLVTPHCAYLSTQAIRQMADMAAENLLAVSRGETSPYAISR